MLYSIIKALTTAPGANLGGKFRALGKMTGMTSEQIIAKVGPPTSRSAMAGGKTLLQWQATGYHIAIRFDANQVFDGITHEYASR